MHITQMNDYTVYTIPQKLDVLTAPQVEEDLLTLIEQGTMQLATDFSQCSYVSSAGLRILLVASKKLTSHQGKFVLFGMSELVYSAFKLAGFNQIMNIQETLN